MSNTTVSLTIGERLAALKLFDAFKGGLSQLSVILEDVKKFVVTEEEWTAAGLTKTPSGDGKTEQWKWDEKEPKSIEIQKDSVDYLTSKIQEKSDAGEVSLADVALISLSAKLK